MLKKIRLLFLGLIVLAGSACVTPTHASSAPSVVITYIQASGPAGGREELVVITNVTNVDIDITNWCLSNKVSVLFACFKPRELGETIKERLILPAQGNATAASQEYGAARSANFDVFTTMYTVTHSVSGSIVGSADTISLVDATGGVRDSYSWLAAVSSGKAFSRILLLTLPNVYAVTGSAADWSMVTYGAFPSNDVKFEGIDEPDPSDPDESGEQAGQVDAPPVALMITELFANPKGTDAGKEFIELFNSDPEHSYSLDNVKLRIGRETAKWYELPAGVTIPPLGYMVLYDTALGFSLVNTSGSVQLYYKNIPLGERIDYSSPKDDMSWVLIDGMWQYSSRATPGAENLTYSADAGDAEGGSSTSLKSCEAHQYRNPETGRCKSAAVTTASSSAPCRSGQERNSETGRCRNVVAASGPTPCKEGQERNPETNRCRSVSKMTDAPHGVKGVQEAPGVQLAWYYWAAIAGIVLLILGYAVWEWRVELRTLWRKLKLSLVKR